MDTSMALDQLNPTDLQSVMAFLVGAGIGFIMLMVVIGIQHRRTVDSLQQGA